MGWPYFRRPLGRAEDDAPAAKIGQREKDIGIRAANAEMTFDADGADNDIHETTSILMPFEIIAAISDYHRCRRSRL